MAPPATPARKLRDPNDIFKSIDPSPRTPPIEALRSTSPTKQPSPRLKSISRRLLNGNSFLRRTSPPARRRTSLSRKRSARSPKQEPEGVGSGNGLKFDIGTPVGQFDTGNVRERVRRWQANGGGVVDGDQGLVQPTCSGPEKRLVAQYTTNNFDDLETSSARVGLEPLALPAPPTPPFAKTKRNSMPTPATHDGEWEDVGVGSEKSDSRQGAYNSAPEDSESCNRARRRKRRIPREARKHDEETIARHMSTRQARSEKSDEKSNADPEANLETADPSTLEITIDEKDGMLVPVNRSRSPTPPPLPNHASSAISDSTEKAKSVATPSVVNSGTSAAGSLDDDGIRIRALRKNSTRPERQERHRQRMQEREELLQRERNRVREEETTKIRTEERLRQQEREREIERIREEERERVREEEKKREEERRKQKEYERHLEKEREREREIRKQRDQEREERRKEREREREREKEREKERQRERIREEERAKVREEARLEQERVRIREEERQRLRRENEKQQDIMSEINRANHGSNGSRKPKDKEREMLAAVEKKIGVDPNQNREDMKDAIKQAVKEVMQEMFGEMMLEDELRLRNLSDKSAGTSTIHTQDTDEVGRSTGETTPDTDWNFLNVNTNSSASTDSPLKRDRGHQRAQSTGSLGEAPPLSPPQRRIGKSTSPPRPRRKAPPSNLPSTISEESSTVSSLSPTRLSRSRTQLSRLSQKELPSSLGDASDTASHPSRSLSTPYSQKPDGDEYFVSVHHPLPRSGIQRFTSHTDLLSILSENKGVRPKSVRSIARSRVTVATLSVDDLLEEVIIDEKRYIRELSVLVEGVVPAIVESLSLSLNEIAGDLGKQNKIRPVVDMGIALERLKHIHSRIPCQNADEFLSWGQGAREVYEGYLKYWQMGFDDLVVDLNAFMNEHELVLMENAEINKKVDVAYLLKRPLVRTRVLAKLFKRINYLKPSPAAHDVHAAFQDLVTAARKKVAEEKARLEDEAASCIDASKALQLHSLEPCYGVVLDPSKRVRARDIFTMQMLHSIGRTIQCTVELYIRDEGRAKTSPDAELMICEVEGKNKWLFFEPLSLKDVVAKQGVGEGEMDLTVKGIMNNGEIWKERISLVTEPMIKLEWLHLLGASANEISRASSLSLRDSLSYAGAGETVEVPDDESLTNDAIYGEINAQMKNLGFVSAPPTPMSDSFSLPSISTARTLSRKESTHMPRKPVVHVAVIPGISDLYDGGELRLPPITMTTLVPSTPAHFIPRNRVVTPPPSTISPDSSASFGVRRSRARRARASAALNGEYKDRKNQSADIPVARANIVRIEKPKSLDLGKPTKNYATLSFQIRDSPPPSPSQISSSYLSSQISSSYTDDQSSILSPEESIYASEIDYSSVLDDEESDNETIPAGQHSSSGSSSTSSRGSRKPADSLLSPLPQDEMPSSPQMARAMMPHVLSPVPERSEIESDEEDGPPPVPLHREPTVVARSQSEGSLDSNVSHQTPKPKRGEIKRRHSSPLKHEYAPSAPSVSSSTESSDESSSGSESSEYESSDSDEDLLDEVPDLEDEDGDLPGPMMSTLFPNRALHIKSKEPSILSPPAAPFKQQVPKTPKPPKSPRSPKTPATPASVSDKSGSNSPVAFKAPALVFTWSPTNTWEKAHPTECKLTIIPGQIEASALIIDPATDLPIEGGQQVLVLDLSPITPIRRGTAVDLSIRAPPSGNFAGGSVMFRSRTPQDCETLYNAINSARLHAGNIHGMSSRNSSSISRAGSVRGYRASSVGSNTATPTFFPSEAPSIISTESSLGSFGSAFRGLRSSLFKGSMSKSNSGSWMSSSSTSSGLAGPRGIINPLGGIPITGIGGEAPYAGTGYISNLKVHLYKRESATKWADLGAGRLNVITPPPGHAARGGGGLNSREKRVVVRDKKGKETLLDAVLGESCFERIARTGIAIHVPSEDDGYIPIHVGAGKGGRSAIYMLQLKGEMEAAETFRIVGKQRY